ncbi:MAG TPA: OsmC family protein [Stellaceae bacterium]|nr:OsmC family protein [Stellaceae bacterium]
MAEGAAKLVATADVEIAESRYACSIITGDHTLTADEPAPEGTDAGPSPFGLLLSSLGSCTAITLRMYADRKSWPLQRVHVRLAFRWEGEGAARTPHIDRSLKLDGSLDAEQRARCAEIAEKTPVTRALKGGIEIKTTLV